MTRQARARKSIPVLNERGPVPLHRQLRDVLVREIVGGRYRAGHRIPSERVLCETYGVSRTTVRQAVSDLEREGRLVRIPAKGTFVAPAKIEQDLARVSRFAETISAVGQSPAVRIISTRRIAASDAVRRALRLDADDAVIRLDIVGHADTDPVVAYHVHLPARYGEPMAAHLLQVQAEGRVRFRMIPEFLQQRFGLTPVWAVQSYEAAVADAPAADLLAVPLGTPLFVSTRTIYTDQDVPVEYDEVLYRGDRYRFTIRRQYAP